MDIKHDFKHSEKILSAILNKTPLFLIDNKETIENADDVNSDKYFKENIIRVFHSYDDKWKIVEFRSCENNDEMWTQIYYTTSDNLSDEEYPRDITKFKWFLLFSDTEKCEVDNFVYPFSVEVNIKSLKEISGIDDIIKLLNLQLIS